MIDLIEFDAWQIVLAARRLAYISDVEIEAIHDELEEAARVLNNLLMKRMPPRMPPKKRRAA